MPLTRFYLYLDQKQYDMAWREAERLLLFGNIDERQKVSLFTGGCQARYTLGEFFGAVKLGEAAVAMAARLGERTQLAMARCWLGCAYRWTGNIREALEQFDGFVREAEEACCQHLLPLAHYNRGVLLEKLQLYPECIGAYELAGKQAEELGQDVQAVMAWQNAAWAHLVHGDVERATPFMQRAMASGLFEQYTHIRAEHLCQEALRHRLLGRPEQALEACEAVFALLGTDGMPRYLAQASWVVAECAFDAGRSGEARLFARMAEEHAVRSHHFQIVNLASELYRRLRLHEEAGAL